MSGELLGAEQRGAGRRQLDRQREPVQAAADLGDRTGVGGGQLEVAVVAEGALKEQSPRRGLLDRFRLIISGTSSGAST